MVSPLFSQGASEVPVGGSSFFKDEPEKVFYGLELVRLKYGGGGDWYNGPSELPNLARFITEKTGIPVFTKGHFVEPMSEELYKFPFLL
jgi:hypothetical protein